MQHSVLYTVKVQDTFVLLTRSSQEWRIGKWTKAGKLRMFSPRTDLFMDQEDLDKVQNVLVSGESKAIGTLEVTLVTEKKGRVLFYIDVHEIATWSPTQGIKFNKLVHPVFKKDKGALSAIASQVVEGLGVFNSLDEGELFRNGPKEWSIFE